MVIRFTKDHEWITVDGTTATVGITEYAQQTLGDVVYVELPPIGKVVKHGQETAVVESVKAASDVYSPVSGTVTAVNDNLNSNPQLVNSDARGDGWFFRLTLANAAEIDTLMTEDQYNDHLKKLGH